MTLKKLYLPVGLVLAVAVSIALPGPGAAARAAGWLPWTVVGIFLVNGYELRLGDFPRQGRFAAAMAITAVLSLLVCPWVGAALAPLLGLSAAAAAGLVVVCSVPPTLSSGIVITEVAGGNTAWALVLTIGLNLLGILTIPVMVAAALGAAVDLDIPAAALLSKLLRLVLAPLAVGWLLKRITGGRKLHPALRYLPSTCVMATVWMTLSANRDELAALNAAALALSLAAAVIVHATLLGANLLSGRLLRLDRPGLKAVVFVGSQKTLPLSLVVLEALSAAAPDGLALGAAVILCLVFHFNQLILDSILASRWSRS